MHRGRRADLPGQDRQDPLCSAARSAGRDAPTTLTESSRPRQRPSRGLGAIGIRLAEFDLAPRVSAQPSFSAADAFFGAAFWRRRSRPVWPTSPPRRCGGAPPSGRPSAPPPRPAPARQRSPRLQASPRAAPSGRAGSRSGARTRRDSPARLSITAARARARRLHARLLDRLLDLGLRVDVGREEERLERECSRPSAGSGRASRPCTKRAECRHRSFIAFQQQHVRAAAPRSPARGRGSTCGQVDPGRLLDASTKRLISIEREYVAVLEGLDLLVLDDRRTGLSRPPSP